MPNVRLFASIAEVAGARVVELEGLTIRDLVRSGAERYGHRWTEVVQHCRVLRNGEPAGPDDPVMPDDEIAILPPVAGG